MRIASTGVIEWLAATTLNDDCTLRGVVALTDDFRKVAGAALLKQQLLPLSMHQKLLTGGIGLLTRIDDGPGQRRNFT